MLIDELRKANMQAIKDRNTNKKNIYSLLISKYQIEKTNNPDKEITDDEVLKIIQKKIKELYEEKEMYLSAHRDENADLIQLQIDEISKYLPKLLTEDEIRQIISSLEDKSIKNVMMHFKENYKSKVDMSLVSKIAKEF